MRIYGQRRHCTPTTSAWELERVRAQKNIQSVTGLLSAKRIWLQQHQQFSHIFFLSCSRSPEALSTTLFLIFVWSDLQFVCRSFFSCSPHSQWLRRKIFFSMFCFHHTIATHQCTTNIEHGFFFFSSPCVNFFYTAITFANQFNGVRITTHVIAVAYSRTFKHTHTLASAKLRWRKQRWKIATKTRCMFGFLFFIPCSLVNLWT